MKALVFTAKSTRFPIFLSYLSTNLLDINAIELISSTTVAGRDLTRHMVMANNDKKNLIISAVKRNLPSSAQTLELDNVLKLNVKDFDEKAICPRSRFIMNSGEGWIKHGRIHFGINLQQRTSFGMC
jgi:hypothetical protein